MVTRTNKPQCAGCSHPISFHGVDFERCRALGCSCPGYTGDTYLAVSTLSVEEVAERLGRSPSWVRRNAEDLGGQWFLRDDLVVQRDSKGRRKTSSAATVCRFDRESVEQKAAV